MISVAMQLSEVTHENEILRLANQDLLHCMEAANTSYMMARAESQLLHTLLMTTHAHLLSGIPGHVLAEWLMQQYERAAKQVNTERRNELVSVYGTRLNGKSFMQPDWSAGDMFQPLVKRGQNFRRQQELRAELQSQHRHMSKIVPQKGPLIPNVGSGGGNFVRTATVSTEKL